MDDWLSEWECKCTLALSQARAFQNTRDDDLNNEDVDVERDDRTQASFEFRKPEISLVSFVVAVAGTPPMAHLPLGKYDSS